MPVADNPGPAGAASPLVSAHELVVPVISETSCLFTNPRSTSILSASASSSQVCSHPSSVSAMFMEISYMIAIALVTVGIFGILGNMVSMVIFSLRQMRVHSINVLLCGLAFTDLLMIILAISVMSVPGIATFHENNELLQSKGFLLFQTCLYPLAMTSQTCSVWILVLITIERFWAVCYPLTVARRFSNKKALVALCTIFLTAIGYNMIRYWEYKSTTDPVTGMLDMASNLKANQTYMNVYFSAMYLIFIVAIPLTALTVLNGYIIHTIRLANKQRRTLSRQQASEHKTTIMMILIVIIFVVCNISPIALNFAEVINPNFFLQPIYLNGTNISHEIINDAAFLASDISNLLVVINSSTTCIIYWSFSQRYRNFCKRLLRCQLWCGQADKCDYTKTFTPGGGKKDTKKYPLFNSFLGSARLTTGTNHSTMYSTQFSRSIPSRTRPSLLPGDTQHSASVRRFSKNGGSGRLNTANPRRANVSFDKHQNHLSLHNHNLQAPLLISSHLDLPIYTETSDLSTLSPQGSVADIRDRTQSCNGQLLTTTSRLTSRTGSPENSSTAASIGNLESIAEKEYLLSNSCEPIDSNCPNVIIEV